VKVTFIVPAFNEAASIGEVLTRVDALGLDRQVIVVVGAGSGIGRETAHRLVKEGAHIVCADLGDWHLAQLDRHRRERVLHDGRLCSTHLSIANRQSSI